MRVFINRPYVEGPWGGGNRTIKTLINVLEKRGHSYCFDIRKDYDVIFCQDPRPDGNTGLRYEHLMSVRKQRGTPIFQRVGDVFFHRGEDQTEYLKATLAHSDKVSFITEWAANFLGFSIDNQRYNVDQLRPPEIFYNCTAERTRDLESKKKKRLITHHWSNNPLKGFDFYLEIDKMLNDRPDLEFVYVGRTPQNFKPNNIKIVDPLKTLEIIAHLRAADVYVTASKIETGGNHVVEAMACGLPVLYHEEGGGICELCKENGIKYKDISEFQVSLNDILNKSVNKFEGTLEETCNKYVDMLESICK